MSKKQCYLIGIAGGSGSGKTSVAMELHKRLPNSVILHLDDFQKIGTQPEELHGFANWELPSYIDWDLFLVVLKKLKNGENTTVTHRDQTHLSESKIETLIPSNTIIVEGYLLFFHPQVRQLLNSLIFLDAPDTTRVSRRTKLKDSAYVENVLLPMHTMYIEPTKKYATLIIDTEKYSIEETVELVRLALPIS